MPLRYRKVSFLINNKIIIKYIRVLPYEILILKNLIFRVYITIILIVFGFNYQKNLSESYFFY